MTEKNTPYITLIGCGKMGSALLRGWLTQSPDKHYAVIDPQGLPDELKHEGDEGHITVYETADDYSTEISTTRMMVLAVKPQILDRVCASISDLSSTDTLIVSIAAGKTISDIAQHFQHRQPVIRAMPNTPASIGCGITVATANNECTARQKKAADEALRAGGDVEWIEDEQLMDAVTALSGSGPAYYYRFTEALAQAGELLGLKKNLATKLARKTFEGSAALSKVSPQVPVSCLRENVTSPGGTTEAALNSMNKNDELQKIVNKAINAARDRGEELSKK